MEVLRGFERSNDKTAVALGYFDGVHLAHLQVINKVVSLKNILGTVPTVLTFSMDTKVPGKGYIQNILTDTTKLDMLEKYGVKKTYMPLFSSIESLSAEEFLKIIVDKLQAKAIVCGYDYTFGHKGLGDVDMLSDLCEKHGIELFVINPVQRLGEIVSSTKIRALITQGKMHEANNLLGYVYFIRTPVIHGRKIGRELGFPTINQYFDDTQVIPKFGVYRSTVYIGDQAYKGITNVGIRPTFTGGDAVTVETHIIGLNHEVYNEVVITSFNDFLREERKFESPDALKDAIKEDIDRLFLK